jgi:hypothetical protein
VADKRNQPFSVKVRAEAGLPPLTATEAHNQFRSNIVCHWGYHALKSSSPSGPFPGIMKMDIWVGRTDKKC